MSFDKVATLKVNDTLYNIRDNYNRDRLTSEKSETNDYDDTLLRNKAALADSITNKGIEADYTDSLIQLADKISQISLGEKPALGNLTNIMSQNADTSESVVYTYPWVCRKGGGSYYTAYEDGTSGYAYYDAYGNADHLDTIAITRLKTINKVAGGSDYIPVLFIDSRIKVAVAIKRNDSNNIYTRINRGSVITNVFPASINIDDFYLKLEINKVDTNIYAVKHYIAGVDENENPDTFVLMNTEYVTEDAPSNCIYLSVLGAENFWGDCQVDTGVNSTDSSSYYNSILYENYIKETCACLKIDGVYKVVLGASSLYPYNEE